MLMLMSTVTVLFFGSELPAAMNQEALSEIVCEMMKNKIGMIIHSTDIPVAHRHGRKPVSQTPDKRGMIVKFCLRKIKHNLTAT